MTKENFKKLVEKRKGKSGYKKLLSIEYYLTRQGANLLSKDFDITNWLIKEDIELINKYAR